MCQFFSAVVLRNGDVRFCEDDSHETLIKRLGLRDDDAHLRQFVRVECVPSHDGTFPHVRVDETTVPTWWTEDAPALEDKVRQVGLRVATAWKVYDETVALAEKVYDETVAPALKAYHETVALALKAYHETVATAKKAYHETVALALKASNKTVAPAQKVYDETRASAWKVYVAAISSIEGYTPAKD